MKRHTKYLLLSVISVLIIFLLGFIIYYLATKSHQEIKISTTERITINNSELLLPDPRLVETFIEYTTLLRAFNISGALTSDDFNKHDYLAFFIKYDHCQEIVSFDEAILERNKITIKFDYQVTCEKCDESVEVFFIPIEKGKVISLDNIKAKYNKNEDDINCDLIEYKGLEKIFLGENTLIINETLVTDYEAYQEILSDNNLSGNLQITDFEKNDYLAYLLKAGEGGCDESSSYLNNLVIATNTVTLNFNLYQGCGCLITSDILYFIPIAKNTFETSPMLEAVFTDVGQEECDPNVAYKPVLYLYPEVKTNVTVSFSKPELLTTTYPKYNHSWQVTAHPNGDLYDEAKIYYYTLYWEEKNETQVDFNTGFYVDGEKAIAFLEDKLAIIGLNRREANEFIMFWLPILENNIHSLVYFELTEEKQSNNKLIIEPKPDSLLRLTMHVKKIDSYIKIKEEKLPVFNRHGFVAVEWGGVVH